MRKKSHISVAKFLIDNMNVNSLHNHKLSFLLGSILPDCMPSFLTRKHTIEETFYILKKEIRNLTEEYDAEKGEGVYFCRHLGIITHYVADYFTLPHNKIFSGSLKDHISYEKKLKFELKSYIHNDNLELSRDKNSSMKTVDDICAFIMKMHQIYIKVANEIKEDCQYIIELCHYVVDAIFQFIEFQREKHLYAVLQH
ncbi:zinc dependent phospholipase C family protein [Clostridium sp. Marseille-P299]|uniref:zinc dependent phospholipase C family protein n=1 Tax=Clostridium sp. Marseille-P299 TaxID=1805477 RepID=UPI00082A438B|nr:zinc dependent phospholipase C family protein [Clostridium sp. Marseille-P299]